MSQNVFWKWSVYFLKPLRWFTKFPSSVAFNSIWTLIKLITILSTIVYHFDKHVLTFVICFTYSDMHHDHNKSKFGRRLCHFLNNLYFRWHYSWQEDMAWPEKWETIVRRKNMSQCLSLICISGNSVFKYDKKLREIALFL